MKKQSLLAMAMVLIFVGNTSLPVEAAGNCYNRKNLAGAKIIVNGREVDQSELKNVLDGLCSQFKNGNTGYCPNIVIPDCNQSGNSNIVIPGCSQFGSNNKPDNCAPETDKEDTTEQAPDTQKPSGGDSSKPNIGKPEVNQPETSVPGNGSGTTEENTTKPETNKPEADSESLSYAEQVVKLVNEERAKVGLHALTLDTNVTAAANVRAKEIVTSFSHIRPDGRKFSTVLTDNGIRFTCAGENIAWGQVSPEQVVSAWMNSEGHRANILNARYTKIGVGHLNFAGRNYWVQLFTC